MEYIITLTLNTSPILSSYEVSNEIRNRTPKSCETMHFKIKLKLPDQSFV
jgi:hypothetical protein